MLLITAHDTPELVIKTWAAIKINCRLQSGNKSPTHNVL